MPAALRSHLLVTLSVLPGIPLLPALPARPPDPSRLVLPPWCLHPSLPGQTSSLRGARGQWETSWTSSVGFPQVLAAFSPPHSHTWFNRFAGYFGGRACGLMADGSPSQSLILSLVPSFPLRDPEGPEGPGFEPGGI